MLIDLTATWWFPWLENPVPFLETLQGRQKLEKRCLLPRKASGEERFGDKGVKCQGFPVVGSGEWGITLGMDELSHKVCYK